MDTLLAFSDTLAFRGVLAAAVLSSFGIYKGLNMRSTGGDTLITRFDRVIPFLPVFTVPYLLYLPYLFGVVAYGIIFSPYYAEIAASALAVQLIAAFVYVTHDTYVPRPGTAGGGAFMRLASLVYRHDRPFCAFPSLHVAYSLLCGYWTAVLFPALMPAAFILTGSIVLSTVFLKQHVVADVVGGIALAVTCLVVIA